MLKQQLPRVLVGMPSHEIHRKVVACIIDLMLHVMRNTYVQDISFRFRGDSIIARARMEMCQGAIEAGASHILFVDSDQVFPATVLERLLHWRKPVVACNIPTKSTPSNSTARLFDLANPRQGRPLYTYHDSVGLKRVWRVGTGVMLIDLEMLRKLPKPWFLDKWVEADQMVQGEDWSFCELLEVHNVPIFVDQRLSWDIGHIGDMEFQHCMVLAGYNMDEANGKIKGVKDEEHSEARGELLAAGNGELVGCVADAS